MLWFRSVLDGGWNSPRMTNQPTKMELQVLHFERIPSTVFRKSTTEISHGIDKFVRNLQEQLQVTSATVHDVRRRDDIHLRPRVRSAHWDRCS